MLSAIDFTTVFISWGGSLLVAVVTAYLAPKFGYRFWRMKQAMHKLPELLRRIESDVSWWKVYAEAGESEDPDAEHLRAAFGWLTTLDIIQDCHGLESRQATKRELATLYQDYSELISKAIGLFYIGQLRREGTPAPEIEVRDKSKFAYLCSSVLDRVAKLRAS